MPTAVLHVLVPLVLVAIFRDFILSREKRRSFPLAYVLIAGLAGILPDIDFVMTWIGALQGKSIMIHRLFTHSLFVPILFLALGFLTLNVKSSGLGRHHLKISNIFFLISFGTLTHLLLDMLVHGGIALYYPLSGELIGLDLTSSLLPPMDELIIPTVEGILLVFWLLYLELKHKISDFI